MDITGGSGVEGVDGTLEHLQQTNDLLLEKVKATLRDVERRPIREEGLLLWLRDLRNLALEMEDLDDLFKYQVLAMEAEESMEVVPVERTAASSSSRIFSLKPVYRYCLSCFHSDVLRLSHASSSPSILDHPSFLKEMSDRLNKNQARFNEIAKQKEALNSPIISGQPSHYVDVDGSSMDRQTGFYPFSISENDGGFLDRLNDLNNLNMNVKELTLSVNVYDCSLQVEESKEVELGIKGQFSRLRIAFSRESMEVDGGKLEKILHYLKPHSHIRELTIGLYNGARLPLWMGDGSFHQLVYIKLYRLNRCKTLSPLHQLQSLEKLSIETWASLEKLVSEEDWGLISVDNILDSETKLFFPKLEHLDIIGCGTMKFLHVYQLTALQKLEISWCKNLEFIEFVDPSTLLEELGDGGNLSSLLTEFHLRGCPRLCLPSNDNVVPPQSLKRIHLKEGCTKLVDWCRSNPNSKWTDIIIQKRY